MRGQCSEVRVEDLQASEWCARDPESQLASSRTGKKVSRSMVSRAKDRRSPPARGGVADETAIEELSSDARLQYH